MSGRRGGAGDEPGAPTTVEPPPVAAARPASPERVVRAALLAPDAPGGG